MNMILYDNILRNVIQNKSNMLWVTFVAEHKVNNFFHVQHFQCFSVCIKIMYKLVYTLQSQRTCLKFLILFSIILIILCLYSIRFFFHLPNFAKYIFHFIKYKWWKVWASSSLRYWIMTNVIFVCQLCLFFVPVHHLFNFSICLARWL